MIQKGLYERYIPDTLLLDTGEGKLYTGRDGLLKRDILLYIWHGEAKNIYVHSPSVLQILDSGKTENESFLVFEFLHGVLVSQVTSEQPLSLKEALAMSIEILEIVRELAREGIRGLKLSADNFWITKQGKLKLINTWDTNRNDAKELTDLFSMMHGMMFGKVEMELPVLHMIEEMSLSIAGDPYVVRKSLTSIWKREQKKSEMTDEDYLAKTAQDLTALYQYIKKAQAESKRPMLSELSEEEEYLPSRKRVRFSFPPLWKSLLTRRISMVAILLIVCVIGVIAFKNGDAESAKSKTPVSQGGKLPAEPGQVTGTIIPDVTGKPLDQAKQELDQQGIRYEYYLQTSIRTKGTIFKQDPEAGMPIKRTEVLSLWVSE